MRPLFKRTLLGATALLAASGCFAVAAGHLGQDIAQQEAAKSNQNFGIVEPLAASSTTNITAAVADDDPTKLVTLAKQLQARKVAQVPGAIDLDMIALWPSDANPEWLIVCNEGGSGEVGL